MSIDVANANSDVSYRDVIEAMGQRRDRREGDTWADVVDCARLLLPYRGKRRNPQRREIERQITERCHIKSATQWVHVRLFERSCHPETGEPTLPFRLHWSTARALIEKRASYEDLMRANDEGWTLTQARAWGINRVKQPANEKAPTLWKHLTKALPSEMRKATGAVDEGQAIAELRRALRAWNKEATA